MPQLANSDSHVLALVATTVRAEFMSNSTAYWFVVDATAMAAMERCGRDARVKEVLHRGGVSRDAKSGILESQKP